MSCLHRMHFVLKQHHHLRGARNCSRKLTAKAPSLYPLSPLIQWEKLLRRRKISAKLCSSISDSVRSSRTKLWGLEETSRVRVQTPTQTTSSYLKTCSRWCSSIKLSLKQPSRFMPPLQAKLPKNTPRTESTSTSPLSDQPYLQDL